MKTFDQHQFDVVQSHHALDELSELLSTHASLSENAEIRPFFRQRRHLAALFGLYSSQILHSDLLAHEYDLFGDFACDVVVGNARKNAYLLVEFEDGGVDSVFVSRGRSTPEWSPRFDHGFSQIVDWLYKIDDVRHTAAFEERFGSRQATFATLLVVGRRSALAKREQARMIWRTQRVIVDSVRIHCVTFDELLDDLRFRLAAHFLD